MDSIVMSCSSEQHLMHQPSQEEIFEIMKKLKDKRITIDEAVALTRGHSSATEKPPRMDSLDPPVEQQYNFSVYKFRYRWQKRILQIDFGTKTIFNIEKGILKRQFPFTQIKSCNSSDGLKFLIKFYGHQDYELEATSLEDKESIMRILNGIMKSPTVPVKFPVRRLSKLGVIHEGLLELHEQGPDSWVKYLVKLNELELILYPTACTLEPVERTLSLSDCNVSASLQNGHPIMSVQTIESIYTFRIPINEQTKNSANSLNLMDKWISLLQKYCTPTPPSPVCAQTPPINGDINAVLSDQTAPPPKQRDSSVYSKAENHLQVCNEIYSNIYNSLPGKDTPTPDLISPPHVIISTRTVPAPPMLPPPRINAPRLPKRTKPFHWDTLPNEKINKSMWGQSNSELKKIDSAKIFHQFQIQDTAFTADGSSDTMKSQIILLDKKIAHNFSIVLKSFHMQPTELKEKLLIISESSGGLTDEQLTNLRRYMPTERDQKMYRSLKGSPSELHIVDQFMLEMCNLPDFGPRVDALLAIRELPTSMKDLQPLVCQTAKACYQLLSSQAFAAVLKYILTMGNHLNENAGKGQARGFRLSSLTKMSQLTMSKEKRFTFLHALVEQILFHEPDLASFPQELTEFEAAPGASIKGLSAEVDVLERELEKIDQYRKVFKNKNPKAASSKAQFMKDLKSVVQQHGTIYRELSKKTVEMKKLYSEVLQKFGEPEDQDSPELFGWISTFIKEFQIAYREVRNT